MIIQISEEIQKKIKEIEDVRKTIRKRGEEKATAISEYEKAIAICLIGLKNGEEFELDGKVIKKPPASIMEKLAKGICWKEKLEMDKAEALYKSAIANMDAICAQLNAYQSLNRYLDRT